MMYWASLVGLLHESDLFRRAVGNALDNLGAGPQEAQWQPVHSAPGFVLRRYGEHTPDSPPVLIVPAPIKRPYIFDLLPSVSVVQRLLAAEFCVYLLAWQEPGRQNGDWGLAEYAGSWIATALDKMDREHGRKAILVGHSLGGTLAAIFAARAAGRVSRLVLVEAPLRFGEHAGALGPLVACSPRAWLLAQSIECAPGSLLDVASVFAAPEEFVVGRWQDAMACLFDAGAAAIHARAVRWTLDEFSLPGRLFAEVVEMLYREDRFARGELRASGTVADPAALAAMPVAAVVDPASRLIPPASALEPLSRPTVFTYHPETGVGLQHVGPLIGRRAHRELWPKIIRWMQGYRA